MDLDPNALEAIRHNETVRLDPERIAEFRLPLPGLPLLGQSSGLQLAYAALAMSELADACRAQQDFLTNLAEAVRQKCNGPVLEIVRKSESQTGE